MSPEVTVLTAVRNGAQFLPETIASIRRQTFDDVEHIIVDDASEDATVAIVEEAMRADRRVRLIRRRERGGPYAAANDGLREARGRFIVRIDADDVALPERIHRQTSFLERTGLRACASFVQALMPNGKLTSEIGGIVCGVRALKWWLCLRHGLTHSTACMERKALEELGGYREAPASQDLRMWCEFARRDWLGIVPEVLVYLRRPGVLSSTVPDLQERLVREVLSDHLNELSPIRWSEEEVRALRPRWTGVPIGKRLAALSRWVRLWESDEELDGSDRRELGRLERRVYWRIARQALRWEGLSVVTLRTLLATGPRHVVTRSM